MENKNQDWIGNGKSVFRAIAASNHSNYEREPTDFYATDPKALEIFLAAIKRDGFILPHKICEPACGMGHLSEVLKKHGYDVQSYDLHDYGYGKTGIDFLTSDVKSKCFLTNPPYKYALSFVKKALENVLPSGYVIMLLKIFFRIIRQSLCTLMQVDKIVPETLISISFQVRQFAMRGLYGKRDSAVNLLSAGFLNFLGKEIIKHESGG